MPKPRKNKNPYAKPTPKRNDARTIIIMAAIIAFVTVPIGFRYYKAAKETAQVRQAETEISAWSGKVLDAVNQEQRHDYAVMPDGQYAVFVSYSTGMGRPKVRYGLGDTLEQAWAQADKKLLNALDHNLEDAEYVKYDIIHEIEEMDDLNTKAKTTNN